MKNAIIKKSLETEHPIINPNFQQVCASHSIFTVEDFLITDMELLTAFAEKHSTSNQLKQGIVQILSIINSQHQPWLNGMDMLIDVQQNKHFLSTGCQGIDILLGGGLHQGYVTELVGRSSSGKTQVCLQTASSAACKYVDSVVFLDTCNSFTSRRVACFVDRLLNSSFNQATKNGVKRAMNNIVCHSVFDIFGLLDVLNHLEFTLRSQGKTGDGKLRLLVIDSISSLISPVLGGGDAHGICPWHCLMVSTGFLLKKLAHEHSLCVLVANHMVSGEGGSSKPALGESWKNVSHVRILLSHDQESNLCNVSILKHPCMASGRSAKFSILD